MHFDPRPAARRVIPLLGLTLLLACNAAQDVTRADSATPDMRAADAKVADARVVSGDALPRIDARIDARIDVPDATVDGGPLDASTGVEAQVTAVSVAGSAGAYTLSVTLQSPDTGCEQYANWWEALDGDGALLYRRILGHSHVDEQPFTRSGGPVDAQPDQVIWVRGHMHLGGYGGALMRGTPSGGFVSAAQPAGWPNVEALPPQPTGCAF